MLKKCINLLNLSLLITNCHSYILRQNDSYFEEPLSVKQENKRVVKSDLKDAPELLADNGDEDATPSAIKEFSEQGCAISIRKDLKEQKDPLYLTPETTQFYPFNENGIIHVPVSAPIELFCSEGFVGNSSGNILLANCVEGMMFDIEGAQHNLGEMSCNSWNNVVARRTGQTCNGGTTLVDVGFQMTPQRFVSQYKVCFNEIEEVTRYVEHTLYKGSKFYQHSSRPSAFEKAGFFTEEDLDTFYTKVYQKQTFDNILGYDIKKYFDNNNNKYLARGHLAAKVDFVFASQQRGTFLYINTAPQWQSFNAGNWLHVEGGLRNWVYNNKLDLNCWTGVYDVTTLPNNSDLPTPLFLYQNTDGSGHIPVPKLFFKIAIEPVSKRGVVLIGVNNPYLTMDDIKKDYILCTDVSDQITYIKWKKTDIKSGYSYACQVSEFRKRVTNLPEFIVNDLLV